MHAVCGNYKSYKRLFFVGLCLMKVVTQPRVPGEGSSLCQIFQGGLSMLSLILQGSFFSAFIPCKHTVCMSGVLCSRALQLWTLCEGRVLQVLGVKPASSSVTTAAPQLHCRVSFVFAQLQLPNRKTPVHESRRGKGNIRVEILIQKEKEDVTLMLSNKGLHILSAVYYHRNDQTSRCQCSVCFSCLCRVPQWLHRRSSCQQLIIRNVVKVQHVNRKRSFF